MTTTTNSLASPSVGETLAGVVVLAVLLALRAGAARSSA